MILVVTSLALVGFADAIPVELKDDGNGLTGPQPSILGSVNKVLKDVSSFDQYQCLQKMICEFMETHQEDVVNTVTQTLGSQGGQFTQSNINQFQNNPSQFLQSPGSQFSQAGQLVSQNLGSQASQFVQQIGNGLTSGQFGNSNTNRFSQNSQFANGQVINGVFYPSSQPVQRPGQQFQQHQTFSNRPAQPASSNSFYDQAASFINNLLPPPRRSRRRLKRQSTDTLHGSAIRLMQSFGLNSLSAYPYVRAAIIGHANRRAPGSCRQLYIECPSGTDGLLNYFNNHNGGLFQNALPSVTDEVGQLFPGVANLPQNLPQIAASTFSDLVSSGSNSAASVASTAGAASQPSTGFSILDAAIDTVAGFIAQGKKK